jgi:hypothetical protein
MSALDEWNENYSMDPKSYLEQYPDAEGADLAEEALQELDQQEQEYKDIELEDGVVIEVDSWKGKKNYHCPVCPQADLELRRLKEHIINEHSLRERQEGEIVIADRFGNVKE